MGIAAGAWLAATVGGATGWISTYTRPRTSSRVAMFGPAVLGALSGVLAYGAFLGAGFVVSLLTFSGAPDPGPAVICVLIGSGAFLSMAWIRSALGSRFGWPAREASRRRPLGDVLEARPTGGPGTMWLGGAALPLLPVLYGIRCLVMQKGSLGTVFWPSTVQGGAAIALGLGWIGVGLLLHFHFFFGIHPRLATRSRTGKRIALIAACAGLSTAGVWSVVARIPR